MIREHTTTLLFGISLLLLHCTHVQAQDYEDEDPCVGIGCNNKGLCIPNSIYSRGYWCECDEGWAGQDCRHPEPTVQCGDKRIDVVIDRGLVQELGIEDDVNYVFFVRRYRKSPMIVVGAYVYVQVELAHVQGANLAVTLDRCFASQSGDPADPVSTKHILIADRCVNSDDSTMQIKQNGESEKSQFKFQMFKWRYSADDVYLHCEVDICSTKNEVCIGDGDECKGDSFFRRRRRSVGSREGVYDPQSLSSVGHIVSQGPIKVTSEKEPSGSEAQTDDYQDDLNLLLAVSLIGMLVVVLGVVGGVYGRRHWRQRRKQAEAEARDATQRHLTSLNFTSERF